MLEVSILIRSRQMSTTSSCAVTGFAVTFLSLHWGVAALRVESGPARFDRGERHRAARFTGPGARLGAFGLLR